MAHHYSAAVAAAIVSLGCTASPGARPAPARTVSAITPADVRARIYLIADDSMLGRQAGYAGNFKMTQYLAAEVARLGLEPGGENGSYFQTVPMVRRAVDSSSSLSVNGERLRLFADFSPIRPTPTLRLGTKSSVDNAIAVYGGRAGDTTGIAPGLAAGRIVVLDAPLDANGKRTGTYSAAATDALKRYPDAAAIAIAALDLLTPASGAGLAGRNAALIAAPGSGRPPPVGILVSANAAERMMGAPIGALVPGGIGRAASLRVGFTDLPVEAPARNVVAILRGSDAALRGEMIAIGAHNDHLGIGPRAVDHDSLRAFNRVMRPEGSQTRASAPTAEQSTRIHVILDSLRRLRPPRRDSIYNGADDDGSGSVAELEIAEALVAAPRPRRSILFVWHTGEEAGLLGSSWFTDHPTVPRDSIVVQLNMDMVGRGTAQDVPKGGPRNLQLIGARRLSTQLGDIIDSVNAREARPYEIDYSFDAPHHPLNRYCRSDHYMYARYGIPIAFFSRGYHIDYHVVTDEPQYINYEGLADVAGFVRDVAVTLANRDSRIVVDGPKPDPRGACRQ